jgi:sugar O-acyltransferase (sialic acid O-acetyltransferase NeuD family)
MKIIFIGAANPETIRMIRAIERVTSNYRVLGFIDNDPAKQGTSFYGFPVIGTVEDIPACLDADTYFVNLITGSAAARYEVTKNAVAKGARLTNFIHPSVDLTMTHIGLGNYVQEGVVLQAEVVLGDNSSVHIGAMIGHESRIGNSTFVAHAASISGCCEIGDGCFIGTNATILPRIKIGKWSIIGAGSVVNKDVPDYSVAIGNPARVIRRNDVSYMDGKVL